MKGDKKCYGLLLALFITAGLSLSVCSGDTSALKHEYLGIPYTGVALPCPVLNSTTGDYYFDFDFSLYSGCITSVGTSFEIEFNGDSAFTGSDSLSLSYSNSTIGASLDNNIYDAHYISSSFVQSNSKYYSNIPNFYNPDDWTNFEYNDNTFYSRIPFGSRGKPPVDNNFSGVLQCNPFTNGAVCGGLWNTSEYVESQVLPYPYSSDGFYRSNSAIDTDSGIHYSYSFSLADLFNHAIPTFSYLRIPLNTYDDYFYNPDNLYQGRSLEFKGVFQFDGTFTWHSGIESNGSYFRINYDGYSPSSDQPLPSRYVDCNTNLITLPNDNLTQLEYSCPLTLPDDYISFTVSLEISGNDNYVWQTDDNWYFSQMFVVTDNDDTAGYSFNSDLTGGGMIIGSDDFVLEQNGANGDEDWYSSLVNLFGFNFLNPFVPLLNLFTDQSSCAQIPTIASMIHSEETQVCPWFDSTTRGITTPVLGLAGSMIVFGFAVHWLGARSGNMFEDSVDTDNYHFRSRGSRKK